MLICIYVYTRLYIGNMFSSLRFGGNKEYLSLSLSLIDTENRFVIIENGLLSCSIEDLHCQFCYLVTNYRHTGLNGK